jgi:hypothetical protein
LQDQRSLERHSERPKPSNKAVHRVNVDKNRILLKLYACMIQNQQGIHHAGLAPRDYDFSRARECVGEIDPATLIDLTGR